MSLSFSSFQYLVLVCMHCCVFFSSSQGNSLTIEPRKPKVAFITAVYGGYEASCRKFVPQTLDSDFICFTDSNAMVVDNYEWIVDRTPYHITSKSKIDDGSYYNSLVNNSSSFNVAKYYKQQWYLIPRLKDYDMVVWLDGTIEITNENTAQILYDSLNNGMTTWEHDVPNRTLHGEYQATMGMINGRYLGQKVQEQYEYYLSHNFNESELRLLTGGTSVWITCMVAFANNARVHSFLDYWYLQTLSRSTQDQIGFPYSVWKTGLIPLTLPNEKVSGSGNHSILHHKHDHSGTNNKWRQRLARNISWCASWLLGYTK